MHEVHSPSWFEITMMIFSMAVAAAGIYHGLQVVYHEDPNCPRRSSQKIPVLYDLVYHKYYVDEIYDATVVEPIKNGSDFLWHGVDDNGH